jgi:hypothetical protein
MLKHISQSCRWITKGAVHFPDLALTPDHPRLVARDLGELLHTSATQSWKASLMTVGSLMEALLFCFLKRNEDYLRYVSGDPSYLVNQGDSLHDYLRIFRRYFSIYIDFLPDYVTSYRDIIHPNHEITMRRIAVSEGAVRQALLFLDRLIQEFEQFGY